MPFPASSCPRTALFLPWKRVFGAALLLSSAGLTSGCTQSGQATPAATPPAVKSKTSPPLLKAKPQTKSLDAIPSSAKGHVVHFVRTQQKVFALTFDDGPQPRYTREVLDILKQNHIRATFFMIGKMVKAYPKIARTVAAEGHVVGNHTWSHPSKPKNASGEFRSTDAELVRVLGRRPDLFRPPYGLLHNGLADAAKKQGDCVILWNSVASDWSKKATPDSIVRNILALAKPGGIALLHDGGGNRSSTVAALPRIIDTLRGRGFRFVTIPQLLRIGSLDTMKEGDFWKKNGLKMTKNGKIEKLKTKPKAVKHAQV